MILSPTTSSSRSTFAVDCRATLSRLIGNLSGFAYRRRFDSRWTMEYVSDGCRDITGYDPHRFIANSSLIFGDLIAFTDLERVNERVRLAVQRRQRTSVEYRIRTAYGAWISVEDRLVPIVDAGGKVIAIEGIIDRARHHPAVNLWSSAEFAKKPTAHPCAFFGTTHTPHAQTERVPDVEYQSVLTTTVPPM